MKDYTYRKEKKFDLDTSNSAWLINVGLLETHWFLDIKWLIKHTTYNKWFII